MAHLQEKATITLGAKDFEVSAFTLDELQDLVPALGELQNAAGAAERLQGMRIVLAKALRMTPEELGQLQMDMVQVTDALAVLMRVTGLEEVGKRAAAARKS